MKARLIAFGEIEIAGRRYAHDVVIDGGKIRKRSKKASKVYRETYGHTPLSLGENLPWDGRQLIVGTGMYGRLPVLPDVHQEAARRKLNGSSCRRRRRAGCWPTARTGTCMPCCMSLVEGWRKLLSEGEPSSDPLS